MSAPASLVVLALLVAACSGESTDLGVNEPLRVEDAQFKPGKLPGTRPPADAKPANEPTPHVTAAGPSGGIPQVMVGQAGWVLAGRVSSDGVAVGVRLADAGSGYWLFPVGSVDEINQGDFAFRATADVSDALAPGNHDVEFVAFDDGGRPGAVLSVPICFDSQIPDNFNACEPTSEPPYQVLSLSWDNAADLDLHLVAPDGKVTDGKHPSTAVPGSNGKVDPAAPGVGVLDHDANAGCVASGPSREDVAWKTKPAPGHYYVYVNLFDACGTPSADFRLGLYQEAPGDAPKTFKVVPFDSPGYFPKVGSLLAVQANGSSALGSYVTEFVVR
jgi:hypothetical protein